MWSVSYGEGINGGVGGDIKPDYAQRLDFEFQKMGALGISVLFASGDSGVYNRLPFHVFEFHPSFPACCPSVTAVGATELNADGSETQGVDFSGGGFSPREYFTLAGNASWQSAAVQAYLSSGVELPPAHLWDRTGRAIPDVSAVGVDFAVMVDGHLNGVSGTSASTPVVAGIFALVNHQLTAAGKPALGFLNPFIYQVRRWKKEEGEEEEEKEKKKKKRRRRGGGGRGGGGRGRRRGRRRRRGGRRGGRGRRAVGSVA